MDTNHDTFPAVNESVLDLSDDALLELAPDGPPGRPRAIAGGAAHGLGNSLFGVLGLVELLLADAEPGSPAAERLVLVRRAALELKETLGALVGATRPALDDDVPAPLDEIVRATARLLPARERGGPARARRALPRGAAPGRGDPATVRQLVLHLLQHAWARAGMDGAVDARGGLGRRAALLRVRASGNGAEPDTGLGLLAAGALARAAGGSLETPAPGELLLRLPLAPAAAEKPRADSAAPTMAPAPDRDDHGSAPR